MVVEEERCERPPFQFVVACQRVNILFRLNFHKRPPAVNLYYFDFLMCSNHGIDGNENSDDDDDVGRTGSRK